MALIDNLSVKTKAVIAFVLCSIIQKVIAFVAMPFYTNLLTLEQYGQFSLYTTWYCVFEVIATIGLCNGVINNGMVEYKDDRDGFVSSVQSLCSFSILVCFVAVVALWPFLKEIIRLPFFVLALIFTQLLFYSSFLLYTTKEKYFFNYKSIVIVNILIALLSNVVAILLIKSNPLNPNNGYLRIVVNVGVYSLFGLYFYINNLLKGRRVYKKDYFKYAFNFSVPLVPYLFLSMGLDQIDSIFISNLSESSALAIYSLNNQIGLLPNFINAALWSVLTPMIYRYLDEKKNKELKGVLISSTLFMIMVGLAPVILAPEIVKVLSNDAYISGIGIIMPMSLTVLWRFVFGFFLTVEMYYAYTYLPAIATFSGLLITLILDYLLIPRLGITVTGYIKLLAYVLMTIMHYIFVLKVSKDLYDYKKIFILLMMGSLCTTLVSCLYQHILVRIICGCLIELLIIIRLIKLLKP